MGWQSWLLESSCRARNRGAPFRLLDGGGRESGAVPDTVGCGVWGATTVSLWWVGPGPSWAQGKVWLAFEGVIVFLLLVFAPLPPPPAPAW